MSEAPSVFELSNATVIRADHPVLEHFNWTVREGEAWAVIGPTGSGKTTLAETLLGKHSLHGGALTWPDYAVLAASLFALIAIGGAFSREQSGTSDFFLARRRIPWWAACLSFLATEISAVTIISVPATAYSENWEYGQFFIGSTLAKFTVALLFIPAFYRYDCTTIYEFLDRRFGRASQVAGSVFFFVSAPLDGYRNHHD